MSLLRDASSLELVVTVPDAATIVEFSRRTYGNLWRKRFEEDLVEILDSNGAPSTGQDHTGGSVTDIVRKMGPGRRPDDERESVGDLQGRHR